MTPADIDVIVLAGGKGTHLAPVLPEGCPKFLAPFGPEPFAARFLRELEAAGFRRAVLALGYQAWAIYNWMADNYRDNMLFKTSTDRPEPDWNIDKAIGLASKLTTSDPVAVCNGDTLWDADFGALIRQYESNGQPTALIRGEVPAGFWLLPRRCLAQERPLDFAFGVDCRAFYDIGTPHGLERAKKMRGIIG